ncbi:hypothetical protein CEJ63_22360, partial [Acinetobacter baumannii]
HPPRLAEGATVPAGRDAQRLSRRRPRHGHRPLAAIVVLAGSAAGAGAGGPTAAPAALERAGPDAGARTGTPVAAGSRQPRVHGPAAVDRHATGPRWKRGRALSTSAPAR